MSMIRELPEEDAKVDIGIDLDAMFSSKKKK